MGNAALEILGRAASNGVHVLDDAGVKDLLPCLGIELGGEAPAGAVELRIALNNTREFGMVISAGLGGTDGALSAGNFKTDRAAVHAATQLTDAGDFLGLFKRSFAYQRLAARATRQGRPSPDALLLDCFGRLLDLAAQVTAGNGEAGLGLSQLDLDGLWLGERVTAPAARCELGARIPQRLDRPIAKIDKLIHPKTIGLIGVSGSGMNFGRIILRNLMGSGYAKEQLTIIRPNEAEIDGVKCVESLRALDHKLDLLIVAVGASAVYDLVDEIIAGNASKVAEYRSGKDKLFGFFVGIAMKASKGKANPAQLNDILKKKLAG